MTGIYTKFRLAGGNSTSSDSQPLGSGHQLNERKGHRPPNIQNRSTIGTFIVVKEKLREPAFRIVGFNSTADA